MPELPEVETVCWRLREGGHGEPLLVGRTFTSFVVDDPNVLRSGDAAAVIGARVVDVTRRAKWITLHVAAAAGDGSTQTTRLLVHLVMTGDLHVTSSPPARFVRWHARLDDGARQLAPRGQRGARRRGGAPGALPRRARLRGRAPRAAARGAAVTAHARGGALRPWRGARR
jgi:formamidopyrimidine-DNA glycosylase